MRAGLAEWRWLTPLLLLGLLLAATALAGCGQRLQPPRTVSDPVQVYVVDYGQHASLVLPDDPPTRMVEWSWGDWDWFALGRTSLADGVRALFGSHQSTLSRRLLAPAANAAELDARLGAQQVLPLTVERAKVSSLNQRLEARWQRRRAETVEDGSGRVFAPDDARYSLFDNSVHELSRWLRALDVRVTGGGVTAAPVLLAPADGPPTSARPTAKR